MTFLFALIVIYLVLAAQFEAARPVRDPGRRADVDLRRVAAAVLRPGTLNIYTQIGLVTLIGLISKHGILMVEFANELQRNIAWAGARRSHRRPRVRLRPILMTTAAMVVGCSRCWPRPVPVPPAGSRSGW